MEDDYYNRKFVVILEKMKENSKKTTKEREDTYSGQCSIMKVVEEKHLPLGKISQKTVSSEKIQFLIKPKC